MVKRVSLTIVLSLIRRCEFAPLLAYAHESGLRDLSDHRRQLFFGALVRRTALLLSILRLTEMMVPYLTTEIFNNLTYECPTQNLLFFVFVLTSPFCRLYLYIGGRDAAFDLKSH